MTASIPRALVGCLLALTLAAGAAACGSPSSNTNTTTGETGSGQLGEVPVGGQDAAVPTPMETPPAGEVAPTAEPTLSPGTIKPTLILTIPPGVFTLPWPTPADCLSHDPATASIKYVDATKVWQVRTSTNVPLAFKREEDAKAGLELVKAYKKHCFIGRNNARPDRARYIMDYWLDPVKPSPAIDSPDCIAHTPSQLTVVDKGASGWLLQGGNELIAYFDTKADADNAVLVMKHYNRHCYIGRGYSGTDRLNYIADWFATI